MRVQAQSKHELDRKGSEQHVVGRPAKERMWPTMLCCAAIIPQGEKKQEGGVPGRLEPGADGVHGACQACAACLEGGIRLERRSTAVTHTATDFMRLRHQSDYWL